MKLHIGCGNKFLDGFKHVDIMAAEHIDYITSCDDLSMISNDSVDEIYACHVLEHISRLNTIAVLKEWNRVLKRGGVLRVAVPDFEAIVAEYIQYKELPKLIGLLYGGQNYTYNFHHMAFDYKYLKDLLEQAGYYGIDTYEWREFLPDGFDDFSRAYLPHMDIENGRLMSLNIICSKK